MNDPLVTSSENRLFSEYIWKPPYRRRILSISALAVICALFEAVNLSALVPLLQILNTDAEPGGTLWTILKTCFGLIGLDLTFINLLAVMALLFVIGQGLMYRKKKAQAQLWFTFSADLKQRVFAGLLAADITYHYGERSGRFIDVLNRQAEYAASLIFVLTEFITFFFFILIYTVILLYISVELTVICLVIALLSMLVINSLIERSRVLGAGTNDTNIRMNEFVTERLGLVKLIRIFSSEDGERERFRELAETYTDTNARFWLNGFKIEIIFQIIIFSLAIVILYSATLVLELPLAMLLVFIFILIRLTDPLRQINAKRHDIAGQFAVLETIDRTLREAAASRTITSGQKTFEELRDRIEFDRVSFAYVPSAPVLDGIGFSLRKNEMVALVGASGAGKSTIADLLIRLIDPTSGKILIDGTDIREFDLASYHRKIGFVSQDSLLFNDTVRNNISYGSSQPADGQVVAAAKMAHAHEFILQLPRGYDTELGERGVKLSGGQRQRIALARALCKQPQILILDEATSALDSEAEKVIRESILAIKNKFTILAIAHRLSTIEHADRIIVIEEGRIAETGTHEDLLRKGGVYARYHRIQHAPAPSPGNRQGDH